MSVFLKCLDDAVKRKELKPSQRKAAEERFYGLMDEHMDDGMAPDDAALRAADDVTEQYRIENDEAVRRRLHRMRANILVWNQMTKDWKGTGKEAVQAWRGFWDIDDRAPYANYSQLREAHLGHLHTHMDGIIAKLKPKWAGIIRPKEGQDLLLREIFGEDTGSGEFKALAEAWKRTVKLGMDKFRLAGGSIRELDNWRIPQKQDYLKLHKAGKEQWVSDWMEWTDWRETRRSNGRRLRTEAERRKFLEEAFDTLSTDGANRLSPDQSARSKNFSNKLENHRVLKLKDADSWMAMHGKYGAGSVFDVMLQHVSDMAHEIAMMQRFGPNPDENIANIATMLRKIDPHLANDEIRKMQALHASVMRETGLSRTNKVGHFTAGLRNLLTSALLGSASLIAIPSDINLAMMSRTYNKLEGMQFIRRYLSLMNPANAQDRQLAVRLGLIAENVQAEAYGARRMMGFDLTGPSWTRRIADVSMNLNLLSPHTQNARWAFGMEMLGMFADHRNTEFDNLPFKAMMERHGLTAADWDKFRAIAPYDERGGLFLRPDDLYDAYPRDRATFDLAARIKVMVLDEGKVAVPDVNLHSRNALISDTDAGTFAGEMMRSAAMFKNFPLTFLLVHLNGRYGTTAIREGRNTAAWMSYIIISSMMLGAFRTQMSNIAQGNDPQDMTDVNFVFHSLMTGGGIGILGDFVFADYNRFGGGPSAALAGPVAQFGDDTLKLTLGNLRQILDGEDTNAMRELIQYVQRYTPGSRNFWSRLAIDRLFWDQLLKMADPDAQEYFDQQAGRQERNYGIRKFFPRGETRPDRGPDLGASIDLSDGLL